MSYQDALDQALTLAHDPLALAAFLDTVPEWRADIEHAMAASRAFASEASAISPTDAGRQRSHHRLTSVLAEQSVQGPAGRRSTLAEILGMLTLPRMVLASAATLALLAFALVVDVSAPGGGTPAAEAVVIEGSVAEVANGLVTISTADSSRLVRLKSDTVLTDGFGNSVEPSRLNAGQKVVLKGSQSGEEVVANTVELPNRLFGTITALQGDSLHLSSSQGEYVIYMTAQTEFEGQPVVGSFVEIELAQADDGSLVALEIEVEDEEEDESEYEHENENENEYNSGPPEEPGQSEYSGSGNEEHRESDDDHEDDDHDEPDDHEEHDEEDD